MQSPSSPIPFAPFTTPEPLPPANETQPADSFLRLPDGSFRRYAVATAETTDKLAEAVEIAVQLGFEIQGGIAACTWETFGETCFGFSQALIRW